MNRRPSEPHSDALTRLRYAPVLSQKSKIKSQKYRLKIKNEITLIIIGETGTIVKQAGLV